MWDPQQSVRFQQLRDQDQEGTLSDASRQELARLMQELAAAESAYVDPATDRLRQERESIEVKNRTLEVLARRKETLARRLRDFLNEAQAERRAIEREWAVVLSPGGHHAIQLRVRRQ